ncbi:hypothetical protein [Anaeromicropila populeti]|uniref:Uncharacterized protein n=1 Tax=Anaeromicropila populeti TaxID=37658 RepID=A0A1I6KMH7_9FIRM|nr:hypothetical protein [Anaeromicropila populeti]SFR92463.1 hypothetical protein SAMN05661086_02551 [Anaeromicropila populeti]
MNYMKLLDKYADMHLFSVLILSEYIKDAAQSLGKALNIKIEDKKIEHVIKSIDKMGVNRVYYVENSEDSRKFIFLNCPRTSYVYQISFRCLSNEVNLIMQAIQPWSSLTLDDLGVPNNEPLIDWMHDTKYESSFNPLFRNLKFNNLI